MATSQATATENDQPDMPDSPGTFVPDGIVDDIVDLLNDRMGREWTRLFIDDMDGDAPPGLIWKAAIAAELAHRIPREDWATVADPDSEYYDVTDFIYSCVPAAAHCTDHFTSDTPGYCGPIFHLQWGGGPSFLTNVTRTYFDAKGNEHEKPVGYRVYTLDPS